MSEIKKKPVGITETILRDAHQSQIAKRMTTEQHAHYLSKDHQIPKCLKLLRIKLRMALFLSV